MSHDASASQKDLPILYVLIKTTTILYIRVSQFRSSKHIAVLFPELGDHLLQYLALSLCDRKQ